MVKIKYLHYIFTLLILINLYFVNVDAFGVTATHWRGNPVNAPIGGVLVEELRFQNMVGDSDIMVYAQMKDGLGIATTPEQTYLVKAKTTDTAVPITIRIPEGTSPGTIYTIVVSFATIGDETEGAVTLGTAIDTAFDVVAVLPSPVEKEEIAPPVNMKLVLGIIISVIIVASIIIWIIKRRKKKM